MSATYIKGHMTLISLFAEPCNFNSTTYNHVVLVLVNFRIVHLENDFDVEHSEYFFYFGNF